ncbi:MAG TPA: 4-alpha-glucanotransferase [Polyangiales bacterium]
MTFVLDERACGLLLHPTSLPGPHGNGDLGPEAYAFVDFLARAGQRWWQMLPVNPVGPGFSPYSGVSAFAGNPLLISLRGLVDDGLLEPHEIALELEPTRAHYDAATELRMALLRRAFLRFDADAFRAELSEFRERSAFWLSDYALFMALRHANARAPWTSWAPELARHEAPALKISALALAHEVAFFEFEQLMFDRQWRALRAYAAARGVGLIGDVPIFVAHDSADVWGNQASFKLDADGQPSFVSGVPPDYFSQTGQRWGTPLYRWKQLARDGYAFWVERMRTTLARFDVIRLDHFIGFARYWQIPAAEETAINGRWMRGPGDELFDAIKLELGALPFIAEDLGLVTRNVKALRKRLGIPGMRILQFAFGGPPGENAFLPHNYPRRCVAYTGTHDNDTAVGWYRDPGQHEGPRTVEAARHERAAANAYLYGDAISDEPFHWAMIRALFASVADTAIVPVQDVLGLGSEARMNRPGVADGNWTYRVAAGDLTPALGERLRRLAERYRRLPKTQSDPAR